MTFVIPTVVSSSYSTFTRKIGPTRRRITVNDLLPDGSPNLADRVETGPSDLASEEWAALRLQPPNLVELREYRLSRLVGELLARDYAGLLMFDPLNIRYATDSTNMQLWATHNPCRVCQWLHGAVGFSCLRAFECPLVSGERSTPWRVILL